MAIIGIYPIFRQTQMLMLSATLPPWLMFPPRAMGYWLGFAQERGQINCMDVVHVA